MRRMETFYGLPPLRRLLCMFSAMIFAPLSSASTCDCIEVGSSWQSFKNAISAAIDEGAKTGTRPHVLFCPFHVQKVHYSYNNYETEKKNMLVLDSSIHIQCHKKRPGDECIIESVGSACTRKMWCMQVISVEASDVWLQGFTMKGSQNGALTIGAGRLGVKLIDMEFSDNSSPEEQAGSVVFADEESKTELFNCKFIDNYGTALQNYGNMIVVKSLFTSNTASAFWMSTDVEMDGGGVGGAIINSEGGMLFLAKSSFIGNKAGEKAPAIWSFDKSGIDGGQNCGLNNHLIDNPSRVCNGIYFKSSGSCEEFSGAACSL